MKKKSTAAPAAKEPRKIAILGTAQTSVFDAPYGDLSWKIWDMSANFQYGKRFDLWFEIHTDDTIEATCKATDGKYAEKYIDFLGKCGKALIAGHRSKHWPDAQYFPLAEILKEFDSDYFTCTFAYMVAYAMYLHVLDVRTGGPGVAEIGCWGVDMVVGEEYTHQKPCAEYWLGRAAQLGIKVTVAPESPILRTNALYGFDNLKLAREFTDRIHSIDVAIAQEEKRFEDEKAIVRGIEKNLIELQACRKLLRQIATKWSL